MCFCVLIGCAPRLACVRVDRTSGFQNICSRDTSCPTKLCELILLRRDDCKKDLRNKIKGMMRERKSKQQSL
jgi:hypothetical protein